MRVYLLILLTLVLFGCQTEEVPVEEPEVILPDITIVAMGDSLTAGLGLSQEDAYPAQLEAILLEKGYSVEIINAGISGETSSAALTRLEWVLKLDPDILILETGPNDGLRGIEPSLTKENIDRILIELTEKNVTVVFTGMQIVQNLGAEYTEAFRQIYVDLSEEHEVIYMPFFLEGVAGVPELNQADQIHPTKEGYAVVVENLLPYVEEALEQEK